MITFLATYEKIRLLYSSLFFVFLNQLKYFLQPINAKMSIRYPTLSWDSNSQPSDNESSPLTGGDPKKKIYCIKLDYAGFEYSDWLKNLQ